MFLEDPKLHSRCPPTLIAPLLRWDRSVVANDLPSIRRLFECEQKVAVRVAPSGLRALQMKMSGYRREVFVEWLHIMLGKGQRSHLLFCRVLLVIPRRQLSVA